MRASAPFPGRPTARPALLVVASRNRDKLAELSHALAALLKARSVYEALARSEPRLAARAIALADDTGLEVEALGGAPGVHSARFAGPEQSYERNVALLLERLKGLPEPRRGARFRTVVAARFPDGREATAEGICEGRILEERRGSGGFGYDPVFFVPEAGRTFAQMALEEKGLLSHRGRAVRAMRRVLAAALAHAGSGVDEAGD